MPPPVPDPSRLFPVPVSVPTTETLDGAAPPHPDDPHAAKGGGEERSRFARVRDIILALLWP